MVDRTLKSSYLVTNSVSAFLSGGLSVVRSVCLSHAFYFVLPYYLTKKTLAADLPVIMAILGSCHSIWVAICNKNNQYTIS